MINTKQIENSILGPDYDFFENYLINYYVSNLDKEIVLDSEDEISKRFYNLISLYDISKTEDPFNKNKSEEEADSLAFYISIGLIQKNAAGGFIINTKMLNKTAESFQNALEKAKTYSIGTM